MTTFCCIDNDVWALHVAVFFLYWTFYESVNITLVKLKQSKTSYHLCWIIMSGKIGFSHRFSLTH
jgi:hypothetical protein